jgi:hypothetical protein
MKRSVNIQQDAAPPQPKEARCPVNLGAAQGQKATSRGERRGGSAPQAWMPRSSSTLSLIGLERSAVNLGERRGERPQRGREGRSPSGASAD